MKNIHFFLFVLLTWLTGSAQRHTADGPTPTCSPTDSSITQSICQGDTLYFGNDTITQSGTYTDTITNAGGCDSVITLVLTVNAPPVVTLSWEAMVQLDYFGADGLGDTIFCNGTQVYLFGGKPVGGIYTGTEVTNNTLYYNWPTNRFDTVTYTYTDTFGCKNSASNTLVVENCSGITPIPTANLFTLSPNPADDHVMIDFDAAYTGSTVYIKDISGRQLLQTKLTSAPQQISTTILPPGIYVVTMFDNGQIGARLLVRE